MAHLDSSKTIAGYITPYAHNGPPRFLKETHKDRRQKKNRKTNPKHFIDNAERRDNGS